jgi:hypothetical protein
MSLAQVYLIVHLLAIALSIGIGFSNIVGFRVAKAAGGEMAKGIASHREALIPYGDGLFAAIIGSGLLLLWNVGGVAGLGGWFHLKLAVVAVWAAGYIAMRLRIRTYLASRNMALVPMIRSIAHGVIAAAVAALVCAVMAFNA